MVNKYEDEGCPWSAPLEALKKPFGELLMIYREMS